MTREEIYKRLDAAKLETDAISDEIAKVEADYRVRIEALMTEQRNKRRELNDAWRAKMDERRKLVEELFIQRQAPTPGPVLKIVRSKGI